MVFKPELTPQFMPQMDGSHEDEINAAIQNLFSQLPNIRTEAVSNSSKEEKLARPSNKNRASLPLQLPPVVQAIPLIQDATAGNPLDELNHQGDNPPTELWGNAVADEARNNFPLHCEQKRMEQQSSSEQGGLPARACSEFICRQWSICGSLSHLPSGVQSTSHTPGLAFQTTDLRVLMEWMYHVGSQQCSE